jgi:hypothetical protein
VGFNIKWDLPLLIIENCAKINETIIRFKIKNPPPVELCWQKKRNP